LAKPLPVRLGPDAPEMLAPNRSAGIIRGKAPTLGPATKEVLVIES